MRLYGQIRVTLPDEEWLWEPDQTLGSEWGAIEEELGGGTFEQWVDGIDDRMWLQCQVLVWFLRHKAGTPSERREVDFRIRQLRLVKVLDPKDVSTEPSDELEPSTQSASSESDPATSTD